MWSIAERSLFKSPPHLPTLLYPSSSATSSLPRWRCQNVCLGWGGEVWGQEGTWRDSRAWKDKLHPGYSGQRSSPYHLLGVLDAGRTRGEAMRVLWGLTSRHRGHRGRGALSGYTTEQNTSTQKEVCPANTSLQSVLLIPACIPGHWPSLFQPPAFKDILVTFHMWCTFIWKGGQRKTDAWEISRTYPCPSSFSQRQFRGLWHPRNLFPLICPWLCGDLTWRTSQLEAGEWRLMNGWMTEWMSDIKMSTSWPCCRDTGGKIQSPLSHCQPPAWAVSSMFMLPGTVLVLLRVSPLLGKKSGILRMENGTPVLEPALIWWQKLPTAQTYLPCSSHWRVQLRPEREDQNDHLNCLSQHLRPQPASYPLRLLFFFSFHHDKCSLYSP